MLMRAAWGNLRSRNATGWSGHGAFAKRGLVALIRAVWRSMTLRRVLVGAVAASVIDRGGWNWAALAARWRVFKIAWSISDQVYRQTNTTRPQYVSVRAGEFTATCYPETLRRQPFDLLCLFSAEILKRSGYLLEAEGLLRRLSMRPGTRDLAGLSLGDLLSVQAGWTVEVAAYEAEALISAIGNFAWARSLSPGWRRVRFEDALLALAAVGADICKPDRLWLEACALMRSGSWEAALDRVRAYTAIKPADYTRQLAETRATYAADRTAGLAKAIANCGRWIGMLDVREVEIARLSDGPRDAVLSVKQVEDVAIVSAAPRVVYGGRVIEYQSSIRFDPVYDVVYQDAEILPTYGMIRAGSLLVADSSHVKRNHWQNFTPGIIAMRDGNALLCRRQPAQFGETTVYYFGNNSNYYHWLIEDMPRLLCLQKNHPAADGYYLVDHLLTDWQQDILLRLGSDPSRWRCVDFLATNKFSRLVAPSLYSKDLCAHPKAVAMLRSRLVADAADATPRAGKRIYLTRKGKQIRAGRLVNEQEVVRLFEAAGFATVDTGSLTFAQQVDLFRDAEIIAGPGGAALTNMIFASPGAKIMVLAPSGAQCETFVSIAGAIGQTIITCVGDSRPSPHPTWINTTFDFSLRLADVRLALDLLEA